MEVGSLVKRFGDEAEVRRLDECCAKGGRARALGCGRRTDIEVGDQGEGPELGDGGVPRGKEVRRG